MAAKPRPFEFTCADCPRGGKGWATPGDLRAHILAEHLGEYQDRQAIEDEIAEHIAMKAATR
jgi:hypothetical protein